VQIGQRSGLNLLLDFIEKDIEYQQVAIIARDDLLKSRADLVRRFMKGYLDSVRFYKTQKEIAIRETMKRLRTSDRANSGVRLCPTGAVFARRWQAEHQRHAARARRYRQGQPESEKLDRATTDRFEFLAVDISFKVQSQASRVVEFNARREQITVDQSTGGLYATDYRR
jgi:hypothetical protein